MAFICCGVVSAVQYADVAVNSIDCAVSSDGATAEFSINIENKGSIAAQNVVLQDKMAGVDVSASQYSINNGDWQDWNQHYINLGTLNAGTTMLVEFKAPITSNTLINKAELSTTTPEFNRYNNRLSYTTQATYTITSTANTGGTINPSGNVNVIKGNSQTFNISPNTGWQITDVIVDGVSQKVIKTYIFNNVQANHTINATFSHITHTITATAGTGGNINPNGTVTVNELDNQTFNITPDTGWQIADVIVDSVSQGVINTYTFNNVVTNHTINATFSHITHTITATAGTGGSINPDNLVTVNELDNQTFNITPNNGWQITDVIVDSVSQGPINTYTFNNVQANHTIYAIFSNITHTITATAGTGGNINPNGTVTVNELDNQTFTITPNTGWQITDVTVDGVSQGAISTYTFNNVIANHSINATFNMITHIYAYVTYLNNAYVSVINTSTNTVIGTIGVGNDPNGVTVSPDGSIAYVANGGSNSVSVINTSTNNVIATIPVGTSPWGIAVSHDGSKAYVTNSNSSTVSVIDTTTNTVTNTIHVGGDPTGVAVTPDGSRVYVANFSTNNVSVIDTTTNTVIATITVGISPAGVAVTPDGTRIYVNNYNSCGISVIDTTTNTVTSTIPVGIYPVDIAMDKEDNRAYVTNTSSSNVSVIDTTNNTVIATIPVGSYPFGIAVSLDGNRAYVASRVDNSVSVIDTATNTVISSISVGNYPLYIAI